MSLAGCIILTTDNGCITSFSPLLTDWMHTLAQSPTLMSFVRVITWQITWLNKECGDQVNLLPGFESSISHVDLLVCFMLLCLWEYDWLICERKASVRRSFWWLLVVLLGFIAFIALTVQGYMLFFGYFCLSLSLVWVVFLVLICHNMILCGSCFFSVFF